MNDEAHNEPSIDLCAICHESLNENTYTLPECNHSFHSNCIITWFRTGKNNCPLCNNNGINSLNDLDTQATWHQRKMAYENYKKLRSFSRKKTAPEQLKKLVSDLKKLEEKNSKLIKDFKNFKKSSFPDLTVSEIIKKHKIIKRNKFNLQWTIRRQKELIGFQHTITNIIIPIKEMV